MSIVELKQNEIGSINGGSWAYSFNVAGYMAGLVSSAFLIERWIRNNMKYAGTANGVNEAANDHIAVQKLGSYGIAICTLIATGLGFGGGLIASVVGYLVDRKSGNVE